MTLSVHMHELAPTTVVCCKPHIVCSNLTGKEILVSGGEKRESSATKIEIDGREIEIHSADRDKMRLAVRVPGYLWAECFDVTYPNGANVSLTLESEDLQCKNPHHQDKTRVARLPAHFLHVLQSDPVRTPVQYCEFLLRKHHVQKGVRPWG